MAVVAAEEEAATTIAVRAMTIAPDTAGEEDVDMATNVGLPIRTEVLPSKTVAGATMAVATMEAVANVDPIREAEATMEEVAVAAAAWRAPTSVDSTAT